MENQKEKKENKKLGILGLMIIIPAVLVTLFASASLYIWQNNKLIEKEKELRKEIDLLEKQIKDYQNRVDDMDNQIKEMEENYTKEPGCKKMVDGNCEPEIYQTYENEELGIKFNYPNEWKLKSEEVTGSFPIEDDESSFDIISVDFERKDNPGITVNFRRPILETGYETFELETSNTYNINGFEIKYNTFQESEEAFENMDLSKEGESFDDGLSLALINTSSEDFSKTYQFHMIAPSENFDEYNKFIILAISTFGKM